MRAFGGTLRALSGWQLLLPLSHCRSTLSAGRRPPLKVQDRTIAAGLLPTCILQLQLAWILPGAQLCGCVRVRVQMRVQIRRVRMQVWVQTISMSAIYRRGCAHTVSNGSARNQRFPRSNGRNCTQKTLAGILRIEIAWLQPGLRRVYANGCLHRRPVCSR